MNNSTKNLIWVILLLVSIAFCIIALKNSFLPTEIILDDGTTSEAYVMGTKDVVYYSISLVGMVASLILGLNIRKKNKK